MKAGLEALQTRWCEMAGPQGWQTWCGWELRAAGVRKGESNWYQQRCSGHLIYLGSIMRIILKVFYFYRYFTFEFQAQRNNHFKGSVALNALRRNGYVLIYLEYLKKKFK